MNYESKEPFPVPNSGTCYPASFTFAAQQMGSRALWAAQYGVAEETGVSDAFGHAAHLVGDCPEVYRRAIHSTHGAVPRAEGDDVERGGGIPRIRHDARWYIWQSMGDKPTCRCH